MTWLQSKDIKAEGTKADIMRQQAAALADEDSDESDEDFDDDDDDDSDSDAAMYVRATPYGPAPLCSSVPKLQSNAYYHANCCLHDERTSHCQEVLLTESHDYVVWGDKFG